MALDRTGHTRVADRRRAHSGSFRPHPMAFGHNACRRAIVRSPGVHRESRHPRPRAVLVARHDPVRHAVPAGSAAHESDEGGCRRPSADPADHRRRATRRPLVRPPGQPPAGDHGARHRDHRNGLLERRTPASRLRAAGAGHDHHRIRSRTGVLAHQHRRALPRECCRTQPGVRPRADHPPTGRDPGCRGDRLDRAGRRTSGDTHTDPAAWGRRDHGRLLGGDRRLRSGARMRRRAALEGADHRAPRCRVGARGATGYAGPDMEPPARGIATGGRGFGKGLWLSTLRHQ